MTTPVTGRAAEALAESFRQMARQDGDWPHLTPHSMADLLLAHNFTDAQRAALVAALLDGYPEILMDATYRAEMGPRWSPHRLDETGQRAYRIDHAERVIARLREAGNE